MSDARELTQEEMATALSWIDGELELDAATAFEARLSEDPELARPVEALGELDALLRRDARTKRGSARKSRRVGTWIALAAAVLLFCFVLSRVLGPRSIECEVALAPGYALAEDWVNEQPGLEGASAPGIAVSRGPNSKPMSAADFLKASEQAEAAVVSTALAAKQVELEAGWFVVPIELSKGALVVVVAFDEAGNATRLYPEVGYEAKLLPKGRSVLPSHRAVHAAGSDALEYRPGFLVPLGAGRLTLIVAAAEFEPPDGLFQLPVIPVDSWITAKRSIDEIERGLEDLDFRCRRLVVHEPK